MTRLTDRNKTVEISMESWTGNGYTSDWSNDFFEVSGLVFDEEADAFVVPDVDYCVSCAREWENGCWDGDKDADPEEIANRCATVDFC